MIFKGFFKNNLEILYSTKPYPDTRDGAGRLFVVLMVLRRGDFVVAAVCVRIRGRRRLSRLGRGRRAQGRRGARAIAAELQIIGAIFSELSQDQYQEENYQGFSRPFQINVRNTSSKFDSSI